jgi:hypothetical protein
MKIDENMRPLKQWRALKKEYPQLGKYLNIGMNERGKSLKNWDKAVFFPVSAWLEIGFKLIGGPQLSNFDLFVESMNKIGVIEAVGTWGYSQGYYRLDPAIYEAVSTTKIPDAIPLSVFTRLPEWCVYIETPNAKFGGDDMYGFYAYLDDDPRDDILELRLCADCDNHLGSTVPISLSDEISISEAISNHINYNMLEIDDAKKIIANDIKPMLSLLLYLCSDAPEIDDAHEPQSTPYRTQAKKVKGGYKIFVPNAPRIWDVGTHTGNIIREYQESEVKNGSTKRPHIRRAHYHGYWTGHRDSADRKYGYKWLYPMIINAENDKK